MRRRATSIIFLAFTLFVAAANIPLGHYQYFIFVIPFVISLGTPERFARIAEFTGLAIIGVYILIVQEMYSGMLILYGAACLLFTAPHNTNRQSIVYIFISSAVIFTVSFFHAKPEEAFGHATLDMLLYAVGTSTLFLMIHNAISQYRHKAKTIDEKYLDIIDELQSLAHDSINLLKRITKDKADD